MGQLSIPRYSHLVRIGTIVDMMVVPGRSRARVLLLVFASLVVTFLPVEPPPARAAPTAVFVRMPAPWKGTVHLPGWLLCDGVVAMSDRPLFHPERIPPTVRRTSNTPPAALDDELVDSISRISATPTGRKLLTSISQLNTQIDRRSRFTVRSQMAVDMPASVVVVPVGPSSVNQRGLPIAVGTDPDLKQRAGVVTSGSASGVVVGVVVGSVAGFTDRLGIARAESLDVSVTRALVVALRSLAGADLNISHSIMVPATVIGDDGRRWNFMEKVPINDLLVHGGPDELALAHRALIDVHALPESRAYRSDPGIGQALARETLSAGSTTAEKIAHVQTLFSLLRDTPTVTGVARELGHHVVPIVGKTLHATHGRKRTTLQLGPKYKPTDGRLIGSISRSELDSPTTSTRLTELMRGAAEREMPAIFLSDAETSAAEARVTSVWRERQAKVAADRAAYEAFSAPPERRFNGSPVLDMSAWQAAGTIPADARRTLISHLDWISPCL